MSRRDAKAALRGAEGFIFDGDGDGFGPGAAGVLERLAQRKIPVAVLTQDTERSEEMIAGELRAGGLRINSAQIVTCTALLASLLRASSQSEPIGLIGSAAQRDRLVEQGVRLAPDGSLAKTALIASIGGFSADELTKACDYVRAGAQFLASGRERTCRRGGANVPGPGALVRAIEHSTHRRARILGKPSPGILKFALQRLGVAAETTVYVTNSSLADARMAYSAGCRSVSIGYAELLTALG